jgi:hypothetical protein
MDHLNKTVNDHRKIALNAEAEEHKTPLKRLRLLGSTLVCGGCLYKKEWLAG